MNTHFASQNVADAPRTPAREASASGGSGYGA
jgi:hypothetical protein